MLSFQLYLLILGTAFVLMLAMLVLFMWAMASLMRAALKGGPTPRHAPSTSRAADVEPVSPRKAPRPWYLQDTTGDVWQQWNSINPATGLPIIPFTGGLHGMGGIDIGGNVWGTSNNED